MSWSVLLLFFLSALGLEEERLKKAEPQAHAPRSIILVDVHMKDMQEKLRSNKHKILQEVAITLNGASSVEFLSLLKCDRINILTLATRNKAPQVSASHEEKQSQMPSPFRWSTRIDVLDIVQMPLSHGISTLVENTTELLIMSFGSFVDVLGRQQTSLNVREVLLTGVSTSTLLSALAGARKAKSRNRTVRRATLYVDECLTSLHGRKTGAVVQKISRWAADEFARLTLLNIEHWRFREPKTLRKGFCFDFSGVPGLRILSVNELILYLDRTAYEKRATGLLLAGRTKITTLHNLIDMPNMDTQCSEAIVPAEKMGHWETGDYAQARDDTKWLLLRKKLAISENT